MAVDLKFCFVSTEQTIGDTIACIDRNARGIALVVDKNHRLLGTLTDGDIRRAILEGSDLKTSVSEVLCAKSNSYYSEPVTASEGTERGALLRLMQERGVRQIPIVDAAQRVVSLVTMEDLLPDQVIPLRALVMAGGLGSRLLPKTENLPKPMLPVGDRPLIEDIFVQLRQAGIKRVNVATHYKSDKISGYFGDGHNFGIELNYVTEDSPLGTAGAIGLLQPEGDNLLIINGDILTRVDFRAMFSFHQEQNAELTVGVRKYDLKVPYGVVECDGILVTKVIEKPVINFFVNAGVYLLSTSVHDYIPPGNRCDMTDLIQILIRDKKEVVSFPIWEYWLDIGQISDYERAQSDIRRGRV